MAVRQSDRLLVGALALLLSAAGPVVCLRAEAEAGASIERTERLSTLLELANAQRAKAGLQPLRANSRLMQAAQTQAEQTASARRLQHVLPDAKYPRPEDRLDASGYPWRAWAENIAFGQRNPSDAVEAWMQSEGHRKNLLNPKYTELGTGVATDATGRPYYVQVFGRPL
jgi:uncharacterized protein YkwD